MNLPLPKTDLPELNLSYQKGEYTPAALWYHNFCYKNEDDKISEQEITDAIAILEKAKRDKAKGEQRKTFTLYGSYLANN